MVSLKSCYRIVVRISCPRLYKKFAQEVPLVEKFNSTLISMISKSCDVEIRMIAFYMHIVSVHKHPPRNFFLMHGRVPTERSPYAVDTVDFKENLLFDLSTAWKLAKENIEKAQCSQKKQRQGWRQGNVSRKGECSMLVRLVDSPTVEPIFVN